MIGYSPKYPLQIDDLVGAYAVTTTLAEVAKQNFINLMLTAPGERIMDKNFGVGLRNYLFEPNTASLTQDIAFAIREQTEKYLPFIQINKVEFNTTAVHGDQILNVYIDFAVPHLGTAESLLIGTSNQEL